MRLFYPTRSAPVTPAPEAVSQLIFI